MKSLKSISLFALTFLACTTSSFAKEVVIRSPMGEDFVFEVDPNDSFFYVIDQLESAFAQSEAENSDYSTHSVSQPREYLVHFMTYSDAAKNAHKAVTKIRTYGTGASEKEEKDISFIVNTLGNASLVKITKERSALKKAGDRIDHVHPLHFLECIFSNERMKVSIFNMQGRGWIWKDFLDGLKGSLDQEANKQNIKSEYLTQFVNRLNVDYTIVSQFVTERRWDDLVNYLIYNIPRSGSDRYDM